MKRIGATLVAVGTSIGALLAIVALTRLPTPGPGAPERAPNVLFIVVDTLRADHLSFYGYPRQTSPVIDALAGESVVFTDVMAQAPATVPSVLQIMTGARVVGRSIPAARPTLAEILRNEGYATMAVVDNPVLELRDTQVGRGFDDFYVNDVLDERLNQQHWKTSMPADVITQRALRWLDARDPERPFFAWLHYFDPHDPYFPPYTQDLPFARETPSDWTGDVRRNPVAANGGGPAAAAPAESDRRHLIDLYDAEIRYMDQSLGDLLDRLRESGLYDQTLIVLTSDHGESFGERGEWLHGRSLHQSQIHVPLLVRLPGEDAVHRTVTTPVQLIDVFPTVCAYLGIDCPGTPGRNVLANEYDEAYTLWNYWVVAREGSWKLIFNTLTNDAELFDLSSDPTEQVDRAASEPEALARLLQRKDAWLKSSWPSYQATLRESKEQVEQLGALGYLESAPEASTPQATGSRGEPE